MRHCTVCGAAAREGAKYCTSCGARLVDSASATMTPAEPEVAPAPPDGATTTVLSDATSDAHQPSAEPASTWADTDEPTARLAARPETEGEGLQEPAAPTYVESWPAADDATAEPEDVAIDPDVATDEPQTPDHAEPDATGAAPPWSAWAGADAETESEPPASDTPDVPSLPQDLWSPPDSGEAGTEGHRGASEWESWSPTASGEATVPSSTGDAAASVRRLLDDLASRIDRLIAPIALGDRGVDADELADQLDRWSRAGTQADDLLEVVQAVRKSPRDLDALTRLADRAPDLELLVRHYQAITSGAGDWARQLRRPAATPVDEDR